MSLVAFCIRLVGRRFLGKLFVADATCSGCGACAQTCPAGAIRLQRGRPTWSLDCDACNRCINLCPRSSIQASLVRVLVHGLGNPALLVALWAGGGPLLGLAVYALATVLEFTVLEGAGSA